MARSQDGIVIAKEPGISEPEIAVAVKATRANTSLERSCHQSFVGHCTNQVLELGIHRTIAVVAIAAHSLH